MYSLRSLENSAMFDLFGNMEEQQKALESKLKEILLDASSQDNAVVVQVDATRKLRDIRIDLAKVDTSDPEQLQDLILTTVNKALEAAEIKAAAEAKKQIDDMLPGGLGGLFGG